MRQTGAAFQAQRMLREELPRDADEAERTIEHRRRNHRSDSPGVFLLKERDQVGEEGLFECGADDDIVHVDQDLELELLAPGDE